MNDHHIWDRQRHHDDSAICPPSFNVYATANLNSNRKILNHVLFIMFACNVVLFFCCISVSLLPQLGFNALFVAFLLLMQNVLVWSIINRVSVLPSVLAPTDFSIGVALGLTIGAGCLAFILSTTFRTYAQCDASQSSTSSSQPTIHNGTIPQTNDPVFQCVCANSVRSMAGIWFWGGLVFWLNFCSSLLIAIGRAELSQSSQYHNISTADGAEPAFVGDYADIPEVRSAHGPSRSGGGQPPRSTDSETAKILSV
jgi:hypothetical protein